MGFLAAHYKECQKALGLSSLRDARLHARRGLPAALRPQLWDLMIQTDLVEDFPRSTVEYCSKLKADVAKNDLLLDRILRSDVKQCQNDDTYFVFEDELRTVLWYWSRDPWINNRMRSNQPSVDYAPNGILPVWGVSCYALPICYLRSEPEMIYMTFRELYVRYFSHLHTVAISSTTPTLPVLCHIFEALFKQCDPALFLHMSHTLGLPPVKYARRWIMYGFIGVLDVEQVLLLWDRILGYDDLVILSVAAVTIFSFRAKYLREAKTEQDVQNSLSDLGAIKIVPLLIDLITRGRTSWLTYSCNS
ncbi:hypothetical protein BC832DRAFT_339384 [Gaertneriomyces semiglobifer]|nr:hypothetical protein BC832DRAFT_339384 [Gaertneriomyces semiglobifer]